MIYILIHILIFGGELKLESKGVIPQIKNSINFTKKSTANKKNDC
jgi:hypothetical protein